MVRRNFSRTNSQLLVLVVLSCCGARLRQAHRQAVLTSRTAPTKCLTSRMAARIGSSLPTKSQVARIAVDIFGSARISGLLECAPGFPYGDQQSLVRDMNSPYNRDAIMAQYSTDHFSFGAQNECALRISRERMQILLHQLNERDGGILQCPEVSAIYTELARAAPTGTVICEVGFNVGASAAAFLHGLSLANGSGYELHSFDREFPEYVTEFLSRVYKEITLTAHKGDMATTLNAFYESGRRCDVLFLDAKHPTDMELSLKIARSANSLFLYHWHFRGSESKDYFLSLLGRAKFEERACLKTICSLTHELSGQFIIRESCFGNIPNGSSKSPWWHETLF